MISRPRVSVIMPVHNGQAHIKEAIHSIINQTLHDFELLVLDDASTDRTASIVSRLAASDDRIVLHRCPRQGLSSILNHGIRIARAELVARMDADDIAKPDRLRTQVLVMDEHPDLVVVGGAVERFTDDGGSRSCIRFPCAPVAVRRLMERHCVVAHPTVMFRRSTVLRVGGYRPIFKRAQDYDLWLRLLDAGHTIVNLKTVLIEYRIHGSSASAAHRRDQLLSARIAQLAHRVRALGQPDPLDHAESISEQLYGAFEPVLPVDRVMESLRLDFADSNSWELPRMNEVVSGLGRLVVSGRGNTSTANLLILLAAEYTRRRDLRGAIRAGSILLSRQPFVVLRLSAEMVTDRVLVLADRIRCSY